MGKKKRSHPDIEEILSRPWCYYCERDFDDLKILISHQKAKHYKCDRCARRLNTAGGLSVHLNQVHKENLTQVENALPNRAAPDIEIFGMEGIPEDILQAHNQRISQEFFAAEAQRRAISGNPAPGGTSGNNQGNSSGVKKPKFESPADLKKRLAEHKAKKAAEAGGSVSSDPNTPAQTATPPVYQAPFPAPAGSPLQQQAYPPFGQPPASAAPAPTPFYGAPPQSYNYGEGFGGPPPVPAPGAFTPGQFPPQPHFSPATQQYGGPAFPPPFPQYPPPQLPQHSASPSNPYPPRLPPSATPSHGQPERQNSLPSAPGLPQRPSFNAPHVSREQLAGMHQGNVSATGEHQPQQPPQQQQQQQAPPHQHNTVSANAQSVDDLISSAVQQSVQAPAAEPLAATPTPAPETTEKSGKKAKRSAKLVYPEQETSPEEKMSSLSGYTFTPPTGGEHYLAPVEGKATGPVQDSDTVLDAQSH